MAYENIKPELDLAMGAKAPKREKMGMAPAIPKHVGISQELLDLRQKHLQSQLGQAKQLGQNQINQGSDAIARKFASMGASGSGAQVAAMQKNIESAGDITRNAQAEIAAGQLSQQEADAGREFQGREADIGRQFQSGENAVGRDFAGSMADRDAAFKQQLSNIDQANKLKGMDLAERQFQMDKETTEFNKRMAELDAAGGDKQLIGGGQISKAINPFGSALNAIGDAKWAVAPVQAGFDAIKNATGISTLICTELHRQGFISDYLLKLDGRFGKQFMATNSDVYRGYLLFAGPVVSMMKKSKIFSHMMAAVFVPWCHWMGNKQDETIPDSLQGFWVHKIMTKALLPLIFKLKTKAALWV